MAEVGDAGLPIHSSILSSFELTKAERVPRGRNGTCFCSTSLLADASEGAADALADFLFQLVDAGKLF